MDSFRDVSLTNSSMAVHGQITELVVSIEDPFRDRTCFADGKIDVVVTLKIRESVVQVIHGWDHSGEVRGPAREEESGVFEDLGRTEDG